MDAPVDTQVQDGVLVITLNRPDSRNAIDMATAVGVGAALDRLDADPDLVCGVVTGAGGTFCAGMDLKAFLTGQVPIVPVRGFAGIVERPPDKPLIAAVEGFALAGGFEVALACDLIIAGQGARFGIPEVKRGLIAGGGGLLRLADRIPAPIAMEWALTGDQVSADRAYAVGLVNAVVPDGQALPTALAMAARIAANGPLAVRTSKQIIVQSPGWPEPERFARMRELAEPVRRSEDAQEGALAFKEKRAPVWQGR